MIAAWFLAVAALVVVFVVGPLLIARAARHAESDDEAVPADIVDDARGAFDERRAS